MHNMPDVRVLVVFMPGHTRWARLVSYVRTGTRAFGHVFVVLPIGDRWLIVNPCRARTELRVLSRMPRMLDGWTAVPYCVTMQGSDARGILLPQLLTCVSFTRRLLGVRRWCLTPYGLFKELTR